MIHRYTAHFQARIYDVDSWGEPSTQQIAAYFEQTAWEASDAAGFGDAWYREHDAAWVIRRLTVARLAPIHYQDQLTVTTWISSMGRVRSSRDYEMRGPHDQLVAAGRADWVFVDRLRGVPKGIDRAVVDRFETGQPTAALIAPAGADGLPGPARTFALAHHAYRYETDSMGHINNTAYLPWLDEALAAALATAGLPLTPPAGRGLRLQGTWYVVDYLRSAMAGDDLEIRSRLAGTTDGGLTLAWEQEVVRLSDGEILVRCASRQQLCNLDEAGLAASAVVQALLQ